MSFFQQAEENMTEVIHSFQFCFSSGFDFLFLSLESNNCTVLHMCVFVDKNTPTNACTGVHTHALQYNFHLQIF